MVICYTVPEIWRVTDVIVIFHFGLFFALYPLNSSKSQNFKNKKKRPGDVIISHVYQKLGLDDVWFLYDVRQMDKQTTDRLTDRKSDI